MDVLVPIAADGSYWNWLNGGSAEPVVGPSVSGGDLYETQQVRWAREQALLNMAVTPLAHAVANQAPQQSSPGLAMSNQQLAISRQPSALAPTNNSSAAVAVGIIALIVFVVAWH